MDLSNIRKAAVDSHSGGVRQMQLFQIYQNKMKAKIPTVAQFIKRTFPIPNLAFQIVKKVKVKEMKAMVEKTEEMRTRGKN